ncbi:putative secreted protein (Por secretion system target) [Lutibacter sp. Hel_I_33_5]|uniref:T9SS type A sorting domain-containing protein n=1 Tax=Lutibacter sp. Hel_I_33_5 TaxID=1566289 RepID=UPI00119CF8C7|nr:T9SS type A sorting domain-containing protein [Lutibacter sp. Hel_I_33_5]TVZ55660.1 putative secreted protein (Por secretion system target) [Lutibacter sp. Hel_I_33_5]
MKKITLLFALLITFSFANAQTDFTENFDTLTHNVWHNDHDDPVNEEQTLGWDRKWKLKDVKAEKPGRYDSSFSLAGRYNTEKSALTAYDLPGGISKVAFNVAQYWGNPTTGVGGFKIFIDDQWVKDVKATVTGKYQVSEAITGADDSKLRTLRIEWFCFDCADGEKQNAAISNVTITTATTLSLENNTLSKSLTIYPNPANGLLNVKLNNNVAAKRVQLVDLTGKSVYSSNNAKAINVSKFARGLYILKVTSNDGATASKKVVLH